MLCYFQLVEQFRGEERLWVCCEQRFQHIQIQFRECVYANFLVSKNDIFQFPSGRIFGVEKVDFPGILRFIQSDIWETPNRQKSLAEHGGAFLILPNTPCVDLLQETVQPKTAEMITLFFTIHIHVLLFKEWPVAEAAIIA